MSLSGEANAVFRKEKPHLTSLSNRAHRQSALTDATVIYYEISAICCPLCW